MQKYFKRNFILPIQEMSPVDKCFLIGKISADLNLNKRSTVDYQKEERRIVLTRDLKTFRLRFSGKTSGRSKLYILNIFGRKVLSNMVVLDVQSLTVYHGMPQFL